MSRKSPSIVQIGRVSKLVLIYLVLTVVAAITVGPFLWMISTSFKSKQEAYVYPPKLIPSRPSIENIRRVTEIVPIFRFMLNTALVAILGTMGQLVWCSTAAYSFSRLEFPGRDQIFLLFLGTMMIPGPVTMIPTFLVVKALGWMDSYEALIMPSLASSFGTFLLRQFFLTIPSELEDAARIDGAGRIRFFVQILLPLSIPVLVTLGLFNFMGRWNSFLWPMLVLRTEDKFLVQQGLAFFRGEHVNMMHLIMTGTSIVVIPLVIVFALGQKYFVQGVVLSGLKG